METLNEIINTIAVWLVIAYLILKPLAQRIEITIERTFFQKKPYGINVTLWKYKRNSSYANHGRTIVAWNWLNPDKIEDKPNAT